MSHSLIFTLIFLIWIQVNPFLTSVLPGFGLIEGLITAPDSGGDVDSMISLGPPFGFLQKSRASVLHFILFFWGGGEVWCCFFFLQISKN